MKTLEIGTSLFINQVIDFIKQGKQVTIRARGISMRPFIEDRRDQIILGPLIKPLHVGDVVLARVENQRYVVHRIVELGHETVVLRGDGNLAVERCCLPDVEALVVGFVRKDRSISVSALRWRIYSYLWQKLLPLRRYILAALKLGKFYR